jgi:hypothetical protein
VTEHGTIMRFAFECPSTYFGTEMVPGTTSRSAMMTTTGFHRRTGPLTKDFLFADFVTCDFASCFAAATGCLDGEVAGRTLAVVARGLTFVATE